MQLPQEFTERMQCILGTEYAAFEQSYQETRKYGLRVNTKKISAEKFEQIAPFHLTPIPWIPGGYYYLEEDAPARHPFYYAGLYYLQEPSAMTPASILPVEPGERVLDLCAAPGGKATALGAKLRGRGILVANDISASRCRALLKNIEVFGIPNSFITNAVPTRLAEQFPEFFDKILVDAPCSGEGMFRKDADTIRAWYPQKPEECAKVQREIILRAADMLRPGGMMLYSTCTFAPEENEEMIRYLLQERPQMKLREVPWQEGFAHGLNGMEQCVRLWPHKMGGEGHFLALLEKEGAWIGVGQYGARRTAAPDRQQKKVLEEFFQDISWKLPMEYTEVRNGQAYLVPEGLPRVSGVTFLRNGLYLGELKKDRFEPSQSLAMALETGEYSRTLELSAADERVNRYLKGETVEVGEEEALQGKGWHLVCVDGYPLGWGKLVKGLLKNKYHAGWRMK